MIERICEFCHTKFFVYPSHLNRGKGRYCSKPCHFASRQKVSGLTQCVCRNCGSNFTASFSAVRRGEAKYCSEKCHSLARLDWINQHRAREINCVYCNEIFLAKPAEINKGKKYCSRSCQAAARQSETVECICKYCGIKFILAAYKVASGGGKYCSRSCANKGYKSSWHDRCDKDLKSLEIACHQCGKFFKTYPSSIALGKKFCSRKCYGDSKRVSVGRSTSIRTKRGLTTVERICDNCGKVFEVPPCRIKNNNGRFCSRACSGIAKRGENNYRWRGGGARGYRGANWVAQRKLARERDNGECQCCHRKRRKGERAFPVHHIVPYLYFNGDWEKANDLSNLITLCDNCHPKAEIGMIAVPKRLF